jgi:predicted Zn-dependent protease
MGIVADSPLSAYVEAVGRRLAEAPPAVPTALSFHLVDQDTPNVFALPDGHVFVTRGLLVAVTSESELANVLAHQIAHMSAHDLPRRASGMDALSFGAVLVRAAVSGRSDGANEFPGFPMGTGIVERFPVAVEAVADARGAARAARAGFDPRGMATALRGLAAVLQAAEGAPPLPGFFFSHPSRPDRLTRAASQADTLAPAAAPPAFSADRARHLQRLDGMLVGPNPADGIFVGNRFLQRVRGYALRLPDGWTRLHSRSAVGAVSPTGGAQIILERRGPGDSPTDVAQRFIDEISVRLGLRIERGERVRFGGLPAHRVLATADTPNGPVQLEVTWFSHAGEIYRFASAARPEAAARYRAVVRNAARSFHALGDRERTEIFEDRLRVVAAAEGETLAALSARVGNVWTLATTAAVNRRAEDARLAAGDDLAVAVRVSYRGRDLSAAPLPR